MDNQVYAVRNSEELKAVSEQNGNIQVISQLSGKELRSPASRWTIRHLIAYRLLIRPEAAFLPVLRPEHDECPICEEGLFQTVDHVNTRTLVEDSPRNLCGKSDHDLIRLPGGFFWIALARAARNEHVDQVRVHPQRERNQVQRECYVSSASAIPGSSSPLLYSSSFEVDMSDVDEDKHDARRDKPEEVTHFIGKDTDTNMGTDIEVRPRVERKMTTTRIAGAPVSAEDDGGLCQMRRDADGWKMLHPYLALLEAKKAFKQYFADKAGRYMPIVSNQTLAQYLGEAAITWKGNQESLQRGVFLIAATNTFVRFLYFSFGQDYSDYLDAIDGETQMQIVNDERRDPYVYMQSTRWFNLQSGEGRKSALCHILALLKWHEDFAGSNSQGSTYRSEDSGSDGDSMDTDE
ncbi:hypothetical protein E0Z10_g6373 [Xylaria hypoxylon]|uniref:Uncharacterized protein n=1 Tax=Xylaria hypoxylon TaxID=37992 RepID=A0A4Z0YGA9_9PEZI|nr:hypothetical protein E0Z10_g6373 [Xylaria hypoxylon]